ncbi:hypothetical protein PLESTB_001309100 [Pleodorina starrii]|uniref:Alkyl transferase n=1 Tax=Pleodorina starrii TaxID=330485 RepID=A0A9W6F6E9_9CHLO|nr:hypothetical protein PLESTM_001022500 [Pleodorina starrii]GLC58018.1 hypothetical protein PLESTB_001309100 [Pleodorina starrii]GLC69591.1 hypothetical protein PLESTF_000852000 [Pleodorina starrii]
MLKSTVNSVRPSSKVVCRALLQQPHINHHHGFDGLSEQLRSRQQSSSQASSSGPQGPIPTHVACIMDGNFRWGSRRGGDWRRGHVEGVNALRRVVKFCRRDGVKALTVYAFSTENWERSREEVAFLMRLMERTLDAEVSELHSQGVRLTFAGDRAALPESLRRSVLRAEEATKDNTALILCVCLSYGGRQDIVHAVQQLCAEVQQGKLVPDQVTEQHLSSRLSTHVTRSQIGDPDLLIRTSGEQRLSNFLLWESAYTELYFTSTCWPDFDAHDWEEAMLYFASRQRRYGGRSSAGQLGRTSRDKPIDGVKPPACCLSGRQDASSITTVIQLFACCFSR